jgi:hypothetical protein
LQVALLDAVVSGQGQQGPHHRVAGAAGKGFGHFSLPPRQFGGGNAGAFSI